MPQKPRYPVTCHDCRQAIHAPAPGAFTTGYARLGNGWRICYPCADKRQRRELEASRQFCAYLSSDGRTVTTWTGGTLARVTAETPCRHNMAGTMYAIHGVPPEGTEFHGRGLGRGMLLRLRRCRR